MSHIDAYSKAVFYDIYYMNKFINDISYFLMKKSLFTKSYDYTDAIYVCTYYISEIIVNMYKRDSLEIRL